MNGMDVYLALAVIVGAYLVGSIPTSYLIGRLAKNVDIRELGSKNIGASNLASQVGAWWVVPVAPFDVFIKGTLPVILASEKILGLGIGIEAASGLAGIAGHNWSIFSGFKGGRGMATAFGATLAVNFPLLIVYASIPTLGVHFTPWKDSAAWWLIAIILMPVWVALLNLPVEIVWFALVFALITITKRITSNSLRDDNKQISLRLIRTRLVFDRDIAARQNWIDQ